MRNCTLVVALWSLRLACNTTSSAASCDVSRSACSMKSARCEVASWHPAMCCFGGRDDTCTDCAPLQCRSTLCKIASRLPSSTGRVCMRAGLTQLVHTSVARSGLLFELPKFGSLIRLDALEKLGEGTLPKNQGGRYWTIRGLCVASTERLKHQDPQPETAPGLITQGCAGRQRASR